MWYISAWLFNLILGCLSATEELYCTDCIVINDRDGNNHPSCYQGRSTSEIPCQTLGYVVSHAQLSNKEVIMEEDHWINHTLTISNVSGLTIRASANKNSTIHCRLPNSSNDTGSGLVFESVLNLTIANIIFERCGALKIGIIERYGIRQMHRSAVYIINSTNIHFRESTFYRNVGRGLFLLKVSGYISVIECEFRENSVLQEEGLAVGGGGGIAIYCGHCSLGHSENLTHYNISGSVFQDNNASSSEVNFFQSLLSSTNYKNDPYYYIYAGKGGGIDIHLRRNSVNTSITVTNCVFLKNTAHYGGGVHVLLQNSVNYINITTCSCLFAHNSARRSGGAITIGHIVKPAVTGNNITIQNTTFSYNWALWGGATNIYTSKANMGIKNHINFISCKWIENTALIGAAMTVKPISTHSTNDNSFPFPTIQNCSFTGNIVLKSAPFSSRKADDSEQVVEKGVIDITLMNIELSKYVKFSGNIGSAIVAKSAKIIVREKSLVEFINNTASYGGAVAQHTFSTIELSNNTEVVFDSNRATELGGAVYVTLPHQTDFIFSRKCFFSYENVLLHPNVWNTSITFINNSAKYGYAIFSDSLLPCSKAAAFNIEENVNSFSLQWIPFKYTPNVTKYTIASSPATISFSIPTSIAPGEWINLHPIARDDFDQLIPSSYRVTIESTIGTLKTSQYISDEGYVQIKGEQNTEFSLTLQTQNTRPISLRRTGRMGSCPVGYTFVRDECVCSASTADRYLVGIPQCDVIAFQALLQRGYWVGCDDHNNSITGYCPAGFCDYNNNSFGQYIHIPRHCAQLNPLCKPYRRGQFCGECVEGYSVYFHSENYKCGPCEYGALGILMYIVSELIPLVLMFIVVMITKVNMTSGVSQSFLLFAQTVHVVNSPPSFTKLPPTGRFFIKIHNLIFGFLRLDFFQLDELSFCLWRGATVLDNLVFSYITTFIAFLFLGSVVILIKHSPRVICCKKISNIPTRSKTPIIHSITTLLILPYIKYTLTSFQILSRVVATGEGGVKHGSFVYGQGNVAYFGPNHLPYAFPAVLVIIVLTLPPPLLLISYPLLWRIKAKLRFTCGNNDDTTFWAIRKLLPLIDSCQGVFKDSCRMFAGLLLLWRVILAGIFAFSEYLSTFYLLTVVATFLIFSIHICFKPYKKRLHNMVDIVMLGNMCLISIFSRNIFSTKHDDNYSISFLNVVLAIKITLMYLPLLVLAGFMLSTVLVRSHIFSKVMKYFKYEEDVKSATKNEVDANRNMTQQQRQKATADEDLFIRATEVNTTPLVLSASSAGFELQSRNIE